jgi:hypothetical protein
MCKFLRSGLILVLCLAWAGQLQADEAAIAAVNRAVKAMGGEDKLGKVKVFQLQGKGTIDFMGVELMIKVKGLFSDPDRFRQDISLDVMGQPVSVIQVFDGQKGWLKLADNTLPLEDVLLSEIKEEVHSYRVNTLLPLVKDKGFTLKSLGESKVKDRPAVGIRAALKGFRDIELYFDKETGLTVKTSRMVMDTMTFQEVRQDSYVSDWKERDGLKYATKARMERGGKKFMEVEVTDYQPLAKADDRQFAKP